VTVKASKRGIREIPFDAIEAETLIDHHRRVSGFRWPSKENDLTTVGIAGPKIEYQHSEERIFVQDTRLETGRQHVLENLTSGMDRIARTKAPTCPAGNSASG
jgi:hypothetical protein